DLGRAGNRAGRERRAQHVHVTRARTHPAFDLRDDVHDVRVTFDRERVADAPRLRVPASGRTMTLPSFMRTRISGDEPTTWVSPRSKKYMYGDGFSARRARYTSTGRALKPMLRRCDGTTWNTSPARMYALQRSTITSNASFVNDDLKSRSSSAAPCVGCG